MPRGASNDSPTHGTRRTWSSLVLGGLVLAAVVSTRWVRLNLSPSLPYGLYRLAALRAPLPRGALVVLPVPASVQPWRWWFSPLLKPVAGVPGGVVCHLGGTLYVDSIDYGAVHQAAHGMPLPRIGEGCSVIPEAHVFLATHAPKSLDSRYFGLVPVGALTAQAFPLWTWR
jgi:conjugative transfer signal peptidase TraF